MLVRFQPNARLFNEIDSLLGFPFVSYPSARRFNRFSEVAVKDSGEKITVVAQLPGVVKEHVTVNVNDGVLTISAERKQPEFKENEQWIRNEISYGKIERSINLPYAVESDNVSATFENGVLRVELPKHENAKPKQIEIR